MDRHEDEVIKNLCEENKRKWNKGLDIAAQRKFERTVKKNIDGFNEIVVEHNGKTSRKIITDEDLKDYGKVAFEKMEFYMAWQYHRRQLKKKGMTKLPRTDKNYILYQLLEVVADNGLKALQMRELDDLKLAIQETHLKVDRKSNLLEKLSKEISERGSTDEITEPSDEFSKLIDEQLDEMDREEEKSGRQTSSSCNNCGARLKPTAKFCGKCGFKQ